ncbi:MAG: hypothetical protein C3F06_09445 [Candidatus Methanoperedenaceae archaeon]|nr:MAG: hypothetical protein C3F06_09445 [Candidatus Methanoperedenaceae archaeon]
MRIKQKLISGFVIISLLVGLVGFLGLYANNHIVTSFEKGEEHFGSILEASNEVSSYSKRAQGHTMLYLTLHNKTDRKKAFDRIESLREQTAILDGKIQDPDALRLLNDTKSLTNEMQYTIESLIELHDNEMEKNGTFDFKNHEKLIRNLDTTASRIRQNGLALVERELELEEELNHAAELKAAQFYRLVFLISIIAIISALIIGLLFDRSISNPINKLKNAAIKIRNGDLGTKIDIKSKDEIGELSNEFNEMAQDLHKSNDEIISSKEYTENIVNSMNDSLIVTSQHGTIKRVNKATILLLGYTEEELIGKHIGLIITNADKLLPDKIDTDRKNIIKSIETSFISKGNKEISIIFSSSVMYDKYGNIQDIVCVAKDITERKLAEDQVAKSLQEKEVLLREIHHRVKNNMQIISSLLNHQMENIRDKNINDDKINGNKINDDNIIDIFTESQNRIISMSLVHEKLYQSRDLRNIDFKDYINDLSINLFQSYNIHSGNIKLNMNVEDILLDIDLAIPTGLIINELITNSLKYAFPNGMKGEINILFRSMNGNMLELVVNDNGIGLPENLDFRKTRSLGLHLVTVLAENQLHGMVDINRIKGTEFQIKFRGIKS